MTCARCCEWPRGGKNSPVPPSSTAARCNPARKAVSGQAMMGRNDARALHVTSADQQDRDQVAELAQQVQDTTGDSVEVAFVDQGYTGEQADQAAQAAGIDLIVVRLPEAKRGFVLLPRRWVVERSFGWLARFRRLARDYERLPETLAGFHFLAFAILMLQRFVHSMAYLL